MDACEEGCRCVEACGTRELDPRIFGWRVLSPMALRLPLNCRSTQGDLNDTYRNVIGAIFTAIMTRAVVYAVRLLNHNGCRSGTQRQWLEDVGGSAARGQGNCCDGGSDVENGVTPIKTRLLRKRSEQYLTVTRPDISYVVYQVSQYVSAPQPTHYATILHTLRYLKGILFHGLFYSTQSPLVLRAFFDADWARDPTDRRSTTGY